MIEVLLRFKEAADFYFFAAITFAAVIWSYDTLKAKKSLNLAPVIILNFALFIAWGILFDVNHDEGAFLHFSWMISRGLVPFRDFWEHHSPFFPLLLAPLIKIAPKSPQVFDLARVFSGILFLANTFMGWRIARQVWQEKAGLSIYLLLISSAAIFGHYFLLRPDLLMIFFILSGLSLCLEIPQKNIFVCLACGMAFGLAMSFITKQYLLVFLPFIAIWLGPKPGRGIKLAAYCAGFCAGILPLIGYLVSLGITRDFIYWVFGFNGRNLQVSVHFPLVILGAGLWATFVLLRRFRQSRDIKAIIVFYAFYLSTVSSLTTTSDLDGLYYLGLWYFICAIAASGAGIPRLLEKLPSLWGRAVISGLVLSALLTPNFAFVWKYRQAGFSRDKKAAAELMEYTRGESAVILLPLHPVFALDATRLYSGWQFNFCAVFDRVREDAKSKAIARTIIDLRPSVVQRTHKKRDFVLEMYQRKLITSADYKELIAFLLANYTPKRIGKDFYYLRKDKLSKD